MIGNETTSRQDVRRVFDFLAGNAERARRESLPQKLTMKRNMLLERQKLQLENPAPDEAAKNVELSMEIAALEDEIGQIKPTEEKVIGFKDLENALSTLGHNCTKKQLEHMIWEVDENLDGVVDWEEFKMMYNRNVSDETGLEPFELFNIVQFMTYLPTLRVDTDFNALITEDDTMSTLFVRYGHDQRYGRVHVEKVMSKLFGDKLKAHGGEGVLSLDDYLRVVSVREYEKKRSSLV